MPRDMLVTGGLGFIGSNFIRLMANRDADVLNIDIATYAGDHRRLAGIHHNTLEIDVADEEIVQVVTRERPKIIVHFAAESHVTRSETGAEIFYRTNVEGTHKVMEAAVTCEPEIVVHISTDEIYGPCDGPPFKEEDKEPGEGKATSAYARSKALADDVALSYTDRIPIVVVRPTNCFGPWQHLEKAIPRWISRALRGERLPVWGDGMQVRDWMHVEDACEGIALLIENGERGEAYNLAPEGSQRTNLEIATAVTRAVGRDADAVYLTEYDRPQHDRRYAVDASRMRALGWKPTLDLDAQIQETVAWYRANDDWWQPLVADAEALYNDALERQTAG